MKIVGVQKLTLLDYPGRIACTVFLDGCNFRCPFCHNSQLLTSSAEAVMSREELLSFLQKRTSVLEGICITGGEPTIHPDLYELLRDIRELGYRIKLDTNGYRPDVLQTVLTEGLADYVAMDIKNGPVGYCQTVGLPGMDLRRIEESLRLLLNADIDYECRTTVVYPLHSEDTIRDMADWLSSVTGGKRIRKLFLQPFVDRETVPVSGLEAPNREVLETFRTILDGCAEQIALRGI